MLEGKAVVGETDMLQTMQEDALDLAAKALDFYDVTDATDIARFIKQVSCNMQEFGSTHLPRKFKHASLVNRMPNLSFQAY